jgi:hypothetical protein
MELKIVPESYAALNANGTIRCLFDTKYTGSSRHSSVAIALAHALVNKFTDALLAHIAQTEEAGARPANADHLAADVKLNAVTVHRRKRFYIVYDMFLKGCPEEVRDKVDRSVNQPIHVIFEAGNAYHLIRRPSLDRQVAQEYAYLQQVDKGPRPYFFDSENPPDYDEGQRVEDPKDPEDGLYETESLGKEEEGRGETLDTE